MERISNYYKINEGNVSLSVRGKHYLPFLWEANIPPIN